MRSDIVNDQRNDKSLEAEAATTTMGTPEVTNQSMDGGDGSASHPWDDWATERRAQSLLADALAACKPNATGEVEADLDALKSAEAAYNRSVARMLLDVAERFADSERWSSPKSVTISMGVHYNILCFTRDRMIRYNAGGETNSSSDVTRVIEERLIIPESAACVHHTSLVYPLYLNPSVAPLPPGPYMGCGWFDMVASALVHPQADPEHGARPLDGSFCMAGLALARTFVALGDERTTSDYAVTCVRRYASRPRHQYSADGCQGWRAIRSSLSAFISLTERIHATWSLYMPLIAPIEHAINRALMPEVVE